MLYYIFKLYIRIYNLSLLYVLDVHAIFSLESILIINNLITEHIISIEIL